MLVRDVDSAEALARRAYELLDVVALTPVVARGVELTLTISIGGIHAGDGLATLDALIEHADSHLYAAKRDGRNRAWVPHDALPSFTTRLTYAAPGNVHRGSSAPRGAAPHRRRSPEPPVRTTFACAPQHPRCITRSTRRTSPGAPLADRLDSLGCWG